MLKKANIQFLSAVFAAFGVIPTASACSWKLLSDEDLFENADKVVLVKVVEIENAEYRGNHLYGTAVIEVIRQYKGPDLKQLKLPYNLGAGNCALNLRYGKTYVLYLDRYNSTVGMPDGNREVSPDSLPLEDLEELSWP